MRKQKWFRLIPPISDSEKNTLGDVIPDDNCTNPLDNLGRFDDYELLKSNLKHLTEREKDVIIRRFGLNDEKPNTFIEIAKKLGLTKERVRQIEEYALVKMRRLFYSSQGDNRFACPA